MKSTIPSRSDVELESGSESTSHPCGLTEKGCASPWDSRTTGSEITSQAAWPVVQATAGDHPLIHRFLVGVCQKPSLAEFQSQCEEPGYEPADRLLIKRGSQIVAHLRLAHREMQFGDQVLPVGLISDVATLPEYRRHGCATALLAAARRILVRDGAVLGLLVTQLPRFYVPRGWVVCGRHCYATTGPRAILSHLRWRDAQRVERQGALLRPVVLQRYNIRLWRHVELAALKRLYGDGSRKAFGALIRSDAYWRWLVGRGGNQRVYVAINGPDKLELDESLAPIVGYAAAREGRVVELMYSPEHTEAAVELLGRVCSEAIERDFLRVRLDAAPGEPLHQLMVQAGAEYGHHEADQGLVFMANLYKPRRFLKLISETLGERAREAGLPRPGQLGLLINNEKYRLSVRRHQVELESGILGRSYLKCTLYDAHQLLLGHLRVRDAVASGRLTVSTRVALEIADALFPRLPFWRPPWDDLQVS